jgi:hypothetical protein
MAQKVHILSSTATHREADEVYLTNVQDLQDANDIGRPAFECRWYLALTLAYFTIIEKKDGPGLCKEVNEGRSQKVMFPLKCINITSGTPESSPSWRYASFMPLTTAYFVTAVCGWSY